MLFRSVGMPGSGKTTVGKRLAMNMNREFIDIDDCIARKAGESIPEIFSQRGEAAFRALERDCVAEAAKSGGLVTATGGGTVLDPENMRALMHNGRVYYLKRDIDKLSTAGRPLSSGNNALEALYKTRHPLYSGYSDVCVDCNGSPESAAQVIEEEFYEAADY